MSGHTRSESLVTFPPEGPCGTASLSKLDVGEDVLSSCLRDSSPITPLSDLLV